MEITANANEVLDKEPVQIYLNEQLRAQTAANLLLFGIQMYQYSYLKTNLEKYYEFDTIEKVKSLPPETLLSLLANHLTNLFTLCTVFENYMKAILIYRGVIIHKITKEGFKKKQQEMPCTIEGVTLERLRLDVHPKHTLGMNALLSPKYLKAHRLPDQLVELLKRCVEPRNRLHFLTSVQYTSDKEYIEQLKAADTFINTDMKLILAKFHGKSNSYRIQ